MWAAATLIFLVLSMDVVNMDFQLSDPGSKPNRRHRRTSGCNMNVTYDKVLLKHATLRSKYIFTGKVYNVSPSTTTQTYKVNIRRVLKGDITDIGVNVKFKTLYSNHCNDSTIIVHSLNSLKCPPLRLRTYAIFLTNPKRNGTQVALNLVIEPVLLTLRNIDIIEAAIKEAYVTNEQSEEDEDEDEIGAATDDEDLSDNSDEN